MTTVFNVLKQPNGTAVANARVEIALVAGAGNAPGFNVSSVETVLSRTIVTTDVNGLCNVDDFT